MSVERAVWLLIEAVEAMSQVYVQRLPESDRTVLEKVYAARDVLDGLPDPFASRSSAETSGVQFARTKDDLCPAEFDAVGYGVIRCELMKGHRTKHYATGHSWSDTDALAVVGPGTEWQDDPEGSGRQYPVVPDAGTEGDPIPCPHCDGVGYVQDRTDEAIPAPLSYEGLKRAQAVAEAANEARHNTVDDASLDPMRCVYCNKPCDDRPVRHEAVCWDCSTDNSSFRVERSADDVSPDFAENRDPNQLIRENAMRVPAVRFHTHSGWCFTRMPNRDVVVSEGVVGVTLNNDTWESVIREVGSRRVEELEAEVERLQGVVEAANSAGVDWRTIADGFATAVRDQIGGNEGLSDLDIDLWSIRIALRDYERACDKKSHD